MTIGSGGSQGARAKMQPGEGGAIEDDDRGFSSLWPLDRGSESTRRLGGWQGGGSCEFLVIEAVTAWKKQLRLKGVAKT